ncbi:MAG: hypothetical protein U1A27_09095 [Phycisphaerae bacterium]
MTVEALQRFLKAQPFVPSELHLADGRTVAIRHPEVVAHTAGGRKVFVALDDKNFELIDLLLVTSGRTRTSGRNGRTRQR